MAGLTMAGKPVSRVWGERSSCISRDGNRGVRPECRGVRTAFSPALSVEKEYFNEYGLLRSKTYGLADDRSGERSMRLYAALRRSE
jgi:hypothetical protein